MDRDRPSRKTKSVNYCESKNFEDDDEDFAFPKSPPGKKAKEMVKQQKSSQESRKPVDVKILERDLEAAISLSMLNPSSVAENIEPSCLSPHLSNCSVDTMRLGLDQITTDSNAPSKEMKGAPAIQTNKQKAQDDEYQPCIVSDSESDNDYSEHDSEDEEFTVKKASKTKKEKVTKNGKAKQPPASAKKDKPKCTGASTPTRTPLTNKNTSDLSSLASASKASKSAACLSPATSRVPKWNPPGQIGKSPSSNSLPGRSPGQGLRLGLSRLVRVKPLHPSVSSH